MNILCNTGYRIKPKSGCECGRAEPITASSEETITRPANVQAMLQTVVDSCCQSDDVCREITLPRHGFFDCGEPEVGTIMNLDLNGDITFREVSRKKEDCNCVSSVRFSIPIRLSTPENCGCGKKCLDRVITVVRSVELCCTKDSQLLAANTKVLSGDAWVSEISCDQVKLTISLSFRSCLQQTVMRICEFPATAICGGKNCHDLRRSFMDKCDLTCGCVSAAKNCPKCN